MIEKFNFEQDTDLASVMGRATLIGGSAYGLYKTAKDIPSMPSAMGHFRKSIAPIAAINPSFNQAVNPIASSISISSFLKGGIPEPQPAYTSTFLKNKADLFTEISSLGGGYKGRSLGLGTEVSNLYEAVQSRFGSVKAFAFSEGEGAAADMIRIIGGDSNVFDIPLINTEGTMTLGGKNANRYTARSALTGYTEGAVNLEGIDVTLARKYTEEMDRIATGKLDPRDIKRSITDKAIWEEARGLKDKSKTGASALQALRKEQFVVDPFGMKTREARLSVMKDISKIPGYAGGSASMFSKGVMATPESLLSRGLPAAEGSISSYQLLRQSQFEGARKPSINWVPELDPGFGQFKIATINDRDALRRAAKKTGLNLGELADEEAIFSSKSKVGIKNKMYSFHIDLEREGTKFTQDLMRDIYGAAEAQGMDPRQVSKAMTSPGGLGGINLDLNKKLKVLQDREMGLGREIDALESVYSTEKMRGSRGTALDGLKRQIAGKRRGLASVKEAMSTFGILGYDALGNPLRLKGGDLSNITRNIRIHDGKLSIATESKYKFGIGSKLFTGGGGGKWTVKGVSDVSSILGWMEAEKIYGTGATAEQAKGLAGAFKDVDLISAEAPVKIKQGILAPREGMTAVMSYSSRVMEGGDPQQIKRLEELGIAGGEFKGSKLSGKQLVSKIQSWHPGEGMEQIFGGEEFLASKINEMVMAPDISSTQSGVFGSGTMSNRAAFNLQAMGLEDVLEDFTGRRMGEYNPLTQLSEIQAAKSLAGDTKARGVDLKTVSGDLDRLFQEDLSARRKFMGDKNMMTINLGKEVGGIDKVTVFASDAMAPYVGASKAGRSPLDRATFDLLASVRNGQDEAFQIAKAKKYQAAFGEVENTVSNKLFGGKIRGSMYGQAVSSLEGMDIAAKEMGAAMRLGDDMQAPLIAMTKSDIKRKFGQEAVKQAAEGRLWGLMTREPIEGTHSSLPVNIRTAEDFGVPGDMEGRIFLSGEDASKSLIRRSLFVDFDKDTLNVIAATSEKSRTAIEGFYGYGKPQSAMGSEFISSLKRMSAFELKGREPQSITSLLNNELVGLNAAQKNLEKGMIGQFSNEFKNIHIGLREQMRPTMGKAAAEAYYLGEDFSHLFVENVLKAKHQRKEALLSGSVEDVLDLFRGTVGTDYAAMGQGEKAMNLQRIFDDLSFGSAEIGDQVRQSNSEIVSEQLAERMGFGREMEGARKIEQAEMRAAEMNSIMDKATNQRNAYRKISNAKNLENVMEAHTLGRELQAMGDYSSTIAQRNISKMSGYKAMLKDASNAASHFMTKGLKNITKYGILPTAGIGLAASLMSKPKIMQPAMNTGALHESEREYTNGIGETAASKTLFSIPEQKFSSFDIRGTADAGTDFDSLRSHAAANMKDLSVRLQDHRSHMDKFTIEDIMKKGY